MSSGYSEIGDIRELDSILNEANKRGMEKVKKFLGTVKKEYDSVIEKIEKRVKLTDSDRKILLEAQQEKLSKEIKSEFLQTRKSIILIDNTIDRKMKAQTNLNLKVSITQTQFERMYVESQAKMMSQHLAKLRVQREYLESILVSLTNALTQVSSMMLVEKFTPVASEIDDLLIKVDEAQAESDRLAGLALDKEAHAKAILELEELESLEDS